MKCSKLRRLLADSGPAALAGNREAEDHLVDCGDCYAVLEAMTEIDSLLPGLESFDVADEVVDQLLASSELGETPENASDSPDGRLAGLRARLNAISPTLAEIEPAKWLGSFFDRARRARLHWGIVAVPAVVLMGIVSILTMRSVEAPLASKTSHLLHQVKLEDSLNEPNERLNREEWEESELQSSAGSGGAFGTGQAVDDESLRAPMKNRIESGKPSRPEPVKLAIPDPASAHPEFAKEGEVTVTGALIPRPDVDGLSSVVDIAQAPPPEELRRDGDVSVERKADGMETNTQSTTENELKAFADNARTPSNSPVGGDEAAGRRREEGGQGNKKLKREADKIQRDQSFYRQETKGREDIETQSLEVVDDAKDLSSVLELDTEFDDNALDAARRFLAARASVEELDFRESRGYWANTYVPGDRTLRQLKARLDSTAGTVGSLHEDAHQISQPFDPPDGAALAVYLHSDRSGVETRERMLIQVGLKGTSRRSGMRPAMTVGLVLDLRAEVTPEAATAMRALLQAFAGATELGDRFSLTVAGRPGGTILPPGDLRHGPLTVAMAELFGDDVSGPVLSLEQAGAAALETVRADDDPNAPLGSSAVIVITSGKLGAVTPELTRIAHGSAIDGVPWSAIGVGRGVDLAELDTLVLAGQGNRRLLEAAADAETLVDRELAAVSRVVARAVRLRIRLAPGVQLVDVVGSERLDENRAQQVRDAEQSIDQRLSRNLGIQTDRGLDEEGIQIVIPSYYADDAHVVLLDVVVPGPGPVADVTVRYKDLVHMKNGIARAHLRVGRAETSAGPLELNVLANLIATEVASGLDAAANAVTMADIGTARTILAGTLDLVRGITALVDGLAQNADLEADTRMLTGYLDVLSKLQVSDPAQIRTVADSLRYAGRLKILPPPAGDDQPE